MNWYIVTYSVPGAKKMRLISANYEEEAIHKARELSPKAWMFEAKSIPQGTRTK